MIGIRPPLPGEAAALAELVDALSAHEGDPVGVFTAAAALRDVIGPGAAARALVASGPEGLKGFVLWHGSYETARAARGAFVSDLFVREGCRGEGLGTRLLRAAARAVKAEGGAYLQLTALAKNERANAFYAKTMEKEPGLAVFFAAGARFDSLAR